MTALEQKHIPGVRRRSCVFKNTRFAERFRRAVQANKLDLRCRVIIENPFVFRALQKVFKSGPGSDPPEIFLDDWPRWDVAASWRWTSVRRNRSTRQVLTIAQPFARRTENPVKRNPRQTPRLCCGHINNPKTESRVFLRITDVHKRNLASIRRPVRKSDLRVCRQTGNSNRLAVR